MSWNNSDDGKDRDPWGGRNREQGPPDLDKLIQAMINQFKRALGLKTTRSSGSGSGAGRGFAFIFGVIVTVLVLIWIASGFFIVAPAEQAVVLRFGKYVQTVGSGPHWVPRLIESYTKVNVQSVYSFDFSADFLTKSSGESDKPKQVINVADMGGAPAANDDTDKNVVYVELSVQYRIADPKKYLFDIVGGKQTLEQAARSALSQVIGQMQLNDVLTKGRDQMALQVTKKLQVLMKKYQSGIDVVVTNIRKAQAPEEVADAFLDVVQAGQDEQRYIQQAQAYASKVVPIAQGVQSRILADAEAYRQKVVLNARAQVASYEAILSVYNRSPQITRERMYLDTLQDVLSHSSKLLVDVPNGGQNVFYLPLDKLMKERQTTAAISDEQAAQAAHDPVSSASHAAPSAYQQRLESLYSTTTSGGN